MIIKLKSKEGANCKIEIKYEQLDKDKCELIEAIVYAPDQEKCSYVVRFSRKEDDHVSFFVKMLELVKEKTGYKFYE